MVTGGVFGIADRIGTIHSFNVRRNTWELVGQMTEPRSRFAIEVIEDVAQQCP